MHNALTYGRLPGQPARVGLHVSNQHGPQIDVIDRGPGIPETVAAQLFRPFFTTSGHGTGLGLYIARELCRANQATLEYVAMPGGAQDVGESVAEGIRREIAEETGVQIELLGLVEVIDSIQRS